MKIPKTLKVGGRTYTIVYPYKFDTSERVQLGFHEPFLQEIKLADINSNGRKFNDQSVMHTFIHEVIHAIDTVYNNNRIQELGDKGEEIIDQLAEGLLQVVRDNDLDLRNG